MAICREPSFQEWNAHNVERPSCNRVFDNRGRCGKDMDDVRKKTLAFCLVLAILMPGCLNNSDDNAVEEDNQLLDNGIVETPVAVPQTDGCDNLNPTHCMLPFPSDAFLDADNTTETGMRVNYATNTLPTSGFGHIPDIPSLNLLDGMSPSTQIMTAFSSKANLTGVADQHTVSLSLEDGHATILLNLDTNQRVAHWVENDARQTDNTKTILFIRTMEPLEPNTKYGVGISNLNVESSLAFQAVLDNLSTDAPDIESRKESMTTLLTALDSNGHNRSGLKAAWAFHTASINSILGGMLHMRSDALTRLGDDGIACNVTTVEDDWHDNGKGFRLIGGTYTVPSYRTPANNAVSMIDRDENGMPQFVGYEEIPFTMAIPQTLANQSKSGPLVVFGHGFLGWGEIYIRELVVDWADEYEVVFVGTDITGWANQDVDTIGLGLFNASYFQHQSDQLQQMLVNQMALARTFKGVCSDLQEMYHNNTNLVDSSDINYMGYSLGGVYGSSIAAFSPDIDRAALWVGATGFSSMIERSTNYASFGDSFAVENAYPERNDRALLIALCQHIWDPSDGDVWLRFTDEGYGNTIDPYRIFSIISVNDAQVPGLSSDRAARVANASVLDSSARLPWGIPTAAGPIESGSIIVYWDGNYPAMPEDNSPPPTSDSGLAHNKIAPIIGVNVMVEAFLNEGIVPDTCDGVCTFDEETDSADI